MGWSVKSKEKSAGKPSQCLPSRDEGLCASDVLLARRRGVLRFIYDEVNDA